MELSKWVICNIINIFNYLSWFIPYNFKVLLPQNKNDLIISNSKWKLFKYEEFKEFEEICLEIIEKVDDKCRFAYSSLISFLLAVPTAEGIKRALEVKLFNYLITSNSMRKI